MANTTAAAGGWHVGRASGQCAACAVALPPATACWAALCDAPILEKETASDPEAKPSKKDKEPKPDVSPFVRLDFCEKCWAEGARLKVPLTAFSFWKTTVPVPEQKKKLLVDDSVLVDVFARMAEKREPSEIRFRFVLALILMRKRLLRYEGMEEKSEGKEAPEVWKMIPRGGGGSAEQPVLVINPHLTAEQITEVSGQLSAILAEEI